MTKIKELREKAKLTQVQFAEKMRVTQSAVSQWESGETTPTLFSVIKAAEVLGCTVDALLGGKTA